MYQSTYSQYFPFTTKKTTTYSQFFQCKVHDSKCGDQHLYTYWTITNIKARWIVRIALFLDSHLRVKLFRPPANMLGGFTVGSLSTTGTSSAVNMPFMLVASIKIQTTKATHLEQTMEALPLWWWTQGSQWLSDRQRAFWLENALTSRSCHQQRSEQESVRLPRGAGGVAVCSRIFSCKAADSRLCHVATVFAICVAIILIKYPEGRHPCWCICLQSLSWARIQAAILGDLWSQLLARYSGDQQNRLVEGRCRDPCTVLQWHS